MIRLAIQAQLGNQMFQYAAVRSLAESLGMGFTWGHPRETFINRLRILLGRARRNRIELDKCFTLSGDSGFSRWRSKLDWLLMARLRKVGNRLPRHEVCHGVWAEAPTELSPFVQSARAVELSGWFQFPGYFDWNRENVLSWYRPRDVYMSCHELAEKELGVPSHSRCCIHVRRGDYLTSDIGLGYRDTGWGLPIEYYHRAWNEIPMGITPVVVSDDLHYAKSALSWLPNARFAEGYPAVVDMLLMRDSAYKIIANSTFSWWGAWLSETPSVNVICPEYFLGWSKNTWYPNSAIYPSDWTMVPVT